MNNEPAARQPHQCAALKKDGTPCRALARSSSPYCIMHDPVSAQIVAAARVAGGKARSKPTPPAEPAALATIADQLRLIEQTVDRVRCGDESISIAKTVLYAVSLARPLVELGELEQRLAALEELTNAKKL